MEKKSDGSWQLESVVGGKQGWKLYVSAGHDGSALKVECSRRSQNPQH